VHVHQHEIRFLLTRGIDSSFAGLSLVEDNETWRQLDHAARSASERCLIVDYQHPDIHVLVPHVGTTEHDGCGLETKGCRHQRGRGYTPLARRVATPWPRRF